MYAPAGVKTSSDFPVPDTMKAWVLGDPGQLTLDGQAGAGAEEGRGAGAHRRGRDLRHRPRRSSPRPAGADPGRPALQQELHARPRVHGHRGGARSRRRRVQDRPARHGRDPRRLRPVQALPRGHVHRPATTTASTTATSTRATAPTASPPTAASASTRSTTSTRWSPIPDDMSDEEATLVVTAGTAMYGLTELGGLVAGESVVVTGPGPIGLLGVGGGQGAGRAARHPDRHARQPPEDRPGARRRPRRQRHATRTRSRPCAGSTAARASTTWSSAPARPTRSTRRSAWSTAAARSASPRSRTSRCRSISPTSCATTSTSTASAARARARRTAPRPSCRQKRFDATKIHTHTFALEDLPTALRYAKRAHRGRHQGGGEGEGRRRAPGGGGVSPARHG